MPTPLTYKEIGWTVSMCQLIALSGMVAIAYTNRDPVADLQALFEHIHEYAGSLRIDPARVGVVAVSGNVPTALTTIRQDASRTPACAVFGYGCLLDLDGATDVAVRRGSLASQTQAPAARSRIFDGMCRCSSRGLDATSFQR